ncbi:hypothetical protein FQZ97_833160 [compost metagenome]
MAHADGEHQEGHEDGIRVQRIAQQRQQAELPDHRDQRGQHHQQRGARAARVPEHHGGGDGDRDGEEHQHRLHAVDQVAHDLGKAGDVHRDAFGLVGRTQRVELGGEAGVVDGLALGVLGEQWHEDHRRFRIARHGLADLARTRHVRGELLQLARRAVKPIGDHRPAFEAVLGHTDPSRGRGPERLHARAVHAGQQEHLVAQASQGVEVLRVINGAARPRHRDAYRVAQAAQLGLMRQEVLDVGMAGGDGLLEAGVELQSRGLPAQQQRDQRAQQHHDGAVVEQRALDQRARAGIKCLSAH